MTMRYPHPQKRNHATLTLYQELAFNHEQRDAHADGALNGGRFSTGQARPGAAGTVGRKAKDSLSPPLRRLCSREAGSKGRSEPTEQSTSRGGLGRENAQGRFGVVLAECFKGIGSPPNVPTPLPIFKLLHPVALSHLMVCDDPYTFVFSHLALPSGSVECWELPRPGCDR